MPTAAKLVAATMLAILGFIMVTVAINIYPDIAHRSIGLTTAAVVVGIFVGWRGLGRRISEDEGSGVSAGFRAGLTMFVWVLFLYAVEDMIAGILKNAYYQPMTALLVIPAGMIECGRMALNVPIIGTMLVLAIVVGKITKSASNRWG